MGGRKQRKKQILERASKVAPACSNYSAPARNLRKTDLGAVIFGCTHNTISECLSNKLFGLPAVHYSYIKNISQGLVLFLFNYSDRKLHGIFEAASQGQMNIDNYAWVADGDKYGTTSYPAQVRVRVKQACLPLPETDFKPIIASNYYESKHFYFELDRDQTNKLIKLFKPSPENSIASSGQIPTRCSILNTSLPETSKGQDYNAVQNWPTPGGTTNLLEPNVGMDPFWEDQNQNSTLSYASALGKTSTAATVAYSSNSTGTWSALFKSQTFFEATNGNHCGIHASKIYEYEGDFLQDNTWEDGQPSGTTTDEANYGQTWVADLSHQENIATDELPWDQKYDENGDSLEGNTWEETHAFETATDEVEWGQTWVSDMNPQANITSDTNGFLQGNTWEESEPIVTTTDEVEHGQTSDSSGQPVNEPSSSPKPFNDNPDFQVFSSVETNESGKEENDEKYDSEVQNTVFEPYTSTNLQSLVHELMQEVQMLKGSQMKQIVKINMLEQESVEAKQEILQLRNRIALLESGSRSIVDPAEVDDQLLREPCSKIVESIFIFGGYDGSSWLSTLDSYIPSHNIINSLSPMNFVKPYASAATLYGELYHFGGGGSHTVESFSPTTNQWMSRPNLYWKNIHVAGASVKDRLFAVGGASGHKCSSQVEYLDLIIGKWLPTRSMESKRLGPAAVELNNALYVTGGYDGASYLSSVERFDPRDEAWCKLPSMNTKKGCHSMVVLNEKLYTIGGFNGDKYIATVECFDTRMDSWVEAEPMNVSRGSLGAFVMGEKLYAIGGVKENGEVLDIVERYKEGSGWEIADLQAIGRRSHFSAIVM